MPGLTSRARRRKRDRGPEGERGAVAVEAALIMPILCLIVFGMIDFSLLLRDYVSVTGAVRAGVRIASTGADAGDCVPSADGSDTTKCPSTKGTVPDLAQNAADAVQRSLTGIDPNKTVNYLLIYEANKNGMPCTNADTCPSDTSQKTMPTNCTGYVNCVMFKWSSSVGAFRYAGAANGGGSWNSTTISACVNQTDSLGVYLNATEQMETGFFGKTMPMSDRNVSKFEPLTATMCASGKHP